MNALWWMPMPELIEMELLKTWKNGVVPGNIRRTVELMSIMTIMVKWESLVSLVVWRFLNKFSGTSGATRWTYGSNRSRPFRTLWVLMHLVCDGCMIRVLCYWLRMYIDTLVNVHFNLKSDKSLYINRMRQEKAKYILCMWVWTWMWLIDHRWHLSMRISWLVVGQVRLAGSTYLDLFLVVADASLWRCREQKGDDSSPVTRVTMCMYCVEPLWWDNRNLRRT
jgi:hypothetical protein